MIDLRNTFDRVVCINLDRRPERWQRLQEHVASVGWPFRPIERFGAVDGEKASRPKWWRASAGAWGCHQSHVRIMHQAIRDGVESLLILEDDAVLVEGFGERVAAFLARVQGDWDGLMLGGQHLMPPEIVAPVLRISPGVLRVRNGNRTHAHGFRQRYLIAAHAHLCNLADHALRPRFHVDHRLGQLHQRGGFDIYAPDPWLIGQAAGSSDIAGDRCTERFWQLTPPAHQRSAKSIVETA